MTTLKPTHEGRIQYFLRPGSDTIQIRFSITENGRSKQVKRSTGEKSYAKAKKKAHTIYTEMLGRAAAGVSTSSTSFRNIANAYLKHYEQLVDAGEKKPEAYKQEKSRVERFMIGFFGDEPIEQIRQPQIDKYILWRKTYWTTGPGKDVKTIKYDRGPQTITREVRKVKPKLATLHSDINCIRRIFAFALRERYLKQSDAFIIQAPKGNLGKRAKFTYDEVNTLLEHLADRILDPEAPPEVNLSRYHLYLFCTIASGTGMRPGEIVSLTWNQIVGWHDGEEVSLRKLVMLHPEEQDIRINVRDTKRGRIRRVRPIGGIGSRIINLWDIADRPDSGELFHRDGNDLVRGFNRALTKELNALGIKYDKMGEARSTNSFRHYYITRMLRKVRSASMVAQNVGTRVENIERFYLNDDVEEFADELKEF